MNSRVSRIAWMALALGTPLALHAQFDFSVDNKPFQIHSFGSQGFAYSNDNNFLTMQTSQGSFAMTDGGVNISTQLTDKLRISAQIYDRNIGQLDKWHPQLDYAFVDYRFKDWFGIRGGRVKTVLGLYTDTQDADFLHTFALLPQSIYPMDLRSVTIAHDGLDLYGNIQLHKAGSLSYTTYAGAKPNDPLTGVYYALEDAGFNVANNSISGSMAGGDLRWNTPVSGLMLGVSEVFQSEHFGNASIQGLPSRSVAAPYRTAAAYGDYEVGKFHFSGEYRRNTVNQNFSEGPLFEVLNFSDTGWFVSAAYRLMSRLEVGAYESRYYLDKSLSAGAQATHIFDQVMTARLDIKRYWYFKVEGHFMNGTGDTFHAHGFYARSNPDGLQPVTNMLVVRTGFNF